MAASNTYFSKSFEKGLKILALFNRETPALNQTEIAGKTGLNMTSAYRYVNTLVEMGFLEKDPATKRLRPSIFCLAFCNNLIGATDHRRLIKNVVDEIYGLHNITIDVALSVDDDMMRIYHREAADTLTYSLTDFTRNCLHNTAIGKSYLSTLPEKELKARIGTLQLSAKTKRTITDKAALLTELIKTKRLGYALAVEEYLPGLISIAAPLVSPHNQRGLGAVSFDFSVLQRSAAEVEAHYGPLVTALAERISAVLPLDGQ
jgi:DNA-binding IclR family transcriptional regulator